MLALSTRSPRGIDERGQSPGSLPIGTLLGKALRAVRNQWVHVAAFVVSGTAAGALVGALFSTLPNIGFSVCTAVAAGIGRLSIWKLVRTNDEPSLS
ncbi:hypothetical protein J3D46_001693 [Paenarthrobacter sp. A20]|nr:hypothetical protein [Paenarthrobacter sp. A20]